MAIFQGQANGASYCGKQGGLVFRNQNGKGVVSNGYKKKKSTGLFLLQSQLYFGEASKDWKTLSTNAKTYWNNYAKETVQTDCAGNVFSLTGQNLFIKVWLQAAEAIGVNVNPHTLTGKLSTAFAVNLTDNFTLSMSSTGLVQWSHPLIILPSELYLVVWISSPMQGKVSYRGNLYRHIAARNTPTTGENETLNYQAHWGSILAGTAGSKARAVFWVVNSVTGYIETKFYNAVAQIT